MGRSLRTAGLWFFGVVAVLVVAALLYVGYVTIATQAGVAADAGTRAGLAVDAPVTIARDGRGVAHIRASTDHDLFFAEGYAMAEDRLLQMDLTRRFVYGRLAEVLGSPVVRTDERMRNFGIRGLADAALAASPPDEQAELAAFAAGVNAAATHEPTPPEYRALFFGFEPWQPVDALAVGYATLIDLDDPAAAVIARDQLHHLLGQAGTDAFLPLTDPNYDVPTNGKPTGPIPALPALPPLTAVAGGHVTLSRPNVTLSLSKGDRQPGTDPEERAPVGSNGWAVGGDRTTTGRAVLANDPHLSLGVPAVWWLVEMRSPHYHVAGAVLAGTPGVTLGHDEHLAWGVTAGETAAMRLLREPVRGSDEFYEGGRWQSAQHRREQIAVRFGKTVDYDVLSTPLGTMIQRNGDSAYLRDWRIAHRATSPLDVFVRLDRARSIEDGLAAMRTLPEPALNVLLADDTGRAAYHLAGGIPMEDTWSRWASDGDTPEPPTLPWDQAPQIAASRKAFIVTSNNRADGAGEPRLAPFWPAPYRAYEVRRALAASRESDGRWSPGAIAAVQRDPYSPAEAEFARLVVAAVQRAKDDQDPSLLPLLEAMRQFDGAVVPDSKGATVVVALRNRMLRELAEAHMPKEVADDYVSASGTFVVTLRALRERPRGWVPHDDWDGYVVAALRRVRDELGATIPPFGTWGAQPLEHPLASFGFSMWNGATFPGRGGSYAPAVQWHGHGQSFRALWTPGDWDASTIDIDAGESGEPGSSHYRDQSAGWVDFTRTTLPFSDNAVRAATHATLTLTR